MTESFKKQLNQYVSLMEEELPIYLPEGSHPQQTVIDAMKYSLMAGGKRVRAVLVLHLCRLCGGGIEKALPFAAAIEMIHAYSLIHDDLPCMDDDDLRRGKPSCHIAFGEAAALLAEDGLLTRAFETALASDTIALVGADRAAKAAGQLALAAGCLGMVGGQMIDLENEGKAVEEKELLNMYALKTGALLRVSARMGCIVAGAEEELIQRADRYAAAVGLAFQIVDDILDVTADEAKLGKHVGSDAENNKTTYVTIHTLEEARARVDQLVEEARAAVRGSRLEDEFLLELAQMLAGRQY